MEAIDITAKDGVRIAGCRYPAQGRTRAVVVLAPAMGVRQDFYAPFAQFLAEQGMAVLSFDYRGIGRSVPAQFRHSLRGFEADLRIWAERDYNAALVAARAWQPRVPLLIVGHSLGGQLPGLVPDNELADGLLTIASGSGYWRDNAAPTRRLVWIMWYFAVPFWTRIFGYFPGKRLRKVGDLPKGVIYQWSRWCRNPHYVSDERGRPLRDGFERIRAPLLCMSFTDDEMMSRRSIDSLHDCYRNAQVERRYIRPEDVQAKRIGHFGFFRPQFRDSLWRQALDWLARHASDHDRAQSAA